MSSRADTAPGVLPPPGRQPSAVPAAAPAGVSRTGAVGRRNRRAARHCGGAAVAAWDTVDRRGDRPNRRYELRVVGESLRRRRPRRGRVLVISAVRPSRKTALAVKATSSVWISPWKLAGVSTFAANSVPGVFDARTAATRRKLAVSTRVADTKTVDAKTAEIDAAVRSAIQFLADPPQLTVHIAEGPAT